ncbi:MAG: hypothetical protein AAF495_14635 [Pseudomonadota bacterium]
MNAPASTPALKACLETLLTEANRQNLYLAATLIGAACEALDEEVAQRNAPIKDFLRQHA